MSSLIDLVNKEDHLLINKHESPVSAAGRYVTFTTNASVVEQETAPATLKWTNKPRRPSQSKFTEEGGEIIVKLFLCKFVKGFVKFVMCKKMSM